jgi:hypothetical protein
MLLLIGVFVAGLIVGFVLALILAQNVAVLPW